MTRDLPSKLKELNEILIPMIPVKPVTGEGCGSKQELIQNLKEEALRLYETKKQNFRSRSRFVRLSVSLF